MTRGSRPGPRARTTEGGAWAWERLERGNVGSQATILELVDPRAGESVLDIGTGSGGLALLAAQTDARVTGIDIAEDGIERARARATEDGLDVRFDVGDAQFLPYADAEFDVVMSTFGIIFASDHRRAARELVRVCRPDGRLGLALMPMHSRSAEWTSIVREFGDDEGGDHPGAFADHVEDLLGDAFELETRLREAPAEAFPSSWDDALEQSGQLRALTATLDPDRLAELRTRIETLLAYWANRPAGYVVVVGRRTAG